VRHLGGAECRSGTDESTAIFKIRLRGLVVITVEALGSSWPRASRQLGSVSSTERGVTSATMSRRSSPVPSGTSGRCHQDSVDLLEEGPSLEPVRADTAVDRSLSRHRWFLLSAGRVAKPAPECLQGACRSCVRPTSVIRKPPVGDTESRQTQAHEERDAHLAACPHERLRLACRRSLHGRNA